MIAALLSRRRVLSIAGAAFGIASCGGGGSKDIKTPTLTFDAPARIVAAPTEERIEFDIAFRDDVLYAVWARQRPAESAHDIYFSSASDESGLEAAAERISDSVADSRRPRVAVNGAGEVTLVWEEGTSPSRAIATVQRDAGAPLFNPLSEFAANTADNEHPALHYSANNTLHVAWDIGGEIFYRRRPSGGSASTAVALPMGSGLDARGPSIASDSASNVFVVWEQTNAQAFRVLRAAASDTGGATFPHFGDLPIPPLTLGMFEPRLAATGSAARFSLVYRLGSGNDRRIRLSVFDSFGSVLAFSRDLLINSVGEGQTPAIAVEGSTVIVAWEEDDAVQARASSDGGANFGVIREVSDGHGVVGTAMRPVLALASGRIFAAWDAHAEGGAIRAGFVSEGSATTP